MADRTFTAGRHELQDLSSVRLPPNGTAFHQHNSALVLAPMAERAFPVVFARRVSDTAAFYERLGFTPYFQLPPEGEPGYVGLRRGSTEIAVVDAVWPRDQYGGTLGDGVRFEMFVYVDKVDSTIKRLRDSGISVLREPADMPWGERVAYVADPDGNPVALAAAAAGAAPSA
ncbi:MAG: VOC family protein [Mycobacteriales bacterium]